ncbi:hypothetical protein GF314_02055 [bacterium]|nr:hypothetical protein [bacterium]
MLAHVDSGRTLRGDRGAVVAADSLAALWRREPDKTAPFSRRLGGSMALGLLGAAAIVNVHGDDTPGDWGNLGAGLGAAVSVAAGLMVGVLSGIMAPAEPDWHLLYSDDPRRGHRSGPPDEKAAFVTRLPRVWLETGLEGATVGWNQETDDTLRGSLGLWLNPTDLLETGLECGLGRPADLPHPDFAAQDLAVSVAARVRLRLQAKDTGPYLGVGIARSGEVADQPAWSACLGVRMRVADRWAVRTEAGTRGAMSRIDGDRPGMAYLALRVDLGLVAP